MAKVHHVSLSITHDNHNGPKGSLRPLPANGGIRQVKCRPQSINCSRGYLPLSNPSLWRRDETPISASSKSHRRRGSRFTHQLLVLLIRPICRARRHPAPTFYHNSSATRRDTAKLTLTFRRPDWMARPIFPATKVASRSPRHAWTLAGRAGGHKSHQRSFYAHRRTFNVVGLPMDWC